MPKKFLLLAFLIIGSLTAGFFVHAQTATTVATNAEVEALNKQIEEKKKKIAEIEQSIESYKKKIADTQLQTISLTNQMTILDNRIEQVNLDVEATEEKLQTLTLELKSLDISITEKTKTLERQKKILAELIRELRREDDKQIVEILSAYSSLSEFYDRLNRVERLQYDLGKTAESVRLAKTDLEAKQKKVLAIKEDYQETHTQLGQKKNELDYQISNKKTLLSSTQASEQKYKTLVSSLRSQYQKIENDISGIEAQVRKKLAEQQKKQPEKFDTDSGDLSWPGSSRRVTAYFWDPSYPYRQVFEHNAIDIAMPQGSAIKASASGYIARAKRCTTASCYAYVMIIHSNGVSTVYGHLSAISVSEEQYVTRGDIIGYSGATPGTVGAGPFTTGPHLHFEVRKNGIPTDPMKYLK